jgi:hypothetical protein
MMRSRFLTILYSSSSKRPQKSFNKYYIPIVTALRGSCKPTYFVPKYISISCIIYEILSVPLILGHSHTYITFLALFLPQVTFLGTQFLNMGIKFWSLHLIISTLPSVDSFCQIGQRWTKEVG